MNVLVLGSGGREHTIAWKISKSPFVKGFCSTRNSGTAMIATNLQIDVNDFEGIKKAVLLNKIDMVVVGPEDPLVNGIHDFFLRKLLKMCQLLDLKKQLLNLKVVRSLQKSSYLNITYLLQHIKVSSQKN